MKLNYKNIEIIELDLTTMCNARCPLCFRSSQLFPEKFKTQFWRSPIQIVEQLKMFPRLTTVYLIGQMSEPTTHPEFIDLVKTLKNMKLKIKICSNGDLHDNEYWKTLGKLLNDDDQVWFTLCGTTQKMHEHYRVGTQLSRILEHAECLRSARKVDGARALLFEYNKDDIHSDEMKRILQNFSRYEIITTSFQPENTDKDFFPIRKDMLAYKKINALANQMMKAKSSQIECQSIYERQIQIDPFGGIWPCYVHFESMSAKFQTWDQDYQQILEKKNSCCRFCQRSILDYCQSHNVPDII